MSTKIVPPQAAPAATLSPIKVLLVEEDLSDLRNYVLSLEQGGYDIRACARYSDGVRALERERFDLIVVSQGGPAFEGRLVVNHAQKLHRSTPILVMTRCPDMKCYLEAMELGALDYLEKPHSPLQFARVVEAYLRPDVSNVSRPPN